MVPVKVVEVRVAGFGGAVSRSDDSVKELDSEAQARWDALKGAVGELAWAIGDPDETAAVFAAIRQIGRNVNLEEVLNALHVPEDAGEHTDGLRQILLRIPDGWGRWIRCSRGWYPIVIELNEQLASLFPGYELHQVKEKFGGLRFYWNSAERVVNPEDPEPERLHVPEGTGAAEKDAAWAEWEPIHDAWVRRLDKYLEADEGISRQTELTSRLNLAEQLVDAAELRASTTCELCGQLGQICSTRGPYPWYKTLCSSCASERDYVPSA